MSETIHRSILARAAKDLIRFATHEEFDYPGDVPESCGWWCDICKQHIDDVDHAKGHKSNCTIAQLAKLLRSKTVSPTPSGITGNKTEAVLK